MPYRSSCSSSKRPAATAFSISLVHRGDGLEPLVVLELADRLAVESDRQSQADRSRVDQHAVRDERCVDARQGVDHALRLDTSERPTAQRGVEALTLDVERLGTVDAEANAAAFATARAALHSLGVRVERVDAGRPGSRESGQAPLAAADLEHAGAVESDQRLDPAVLDVVQVGNVHG